MTEYKGLSSRSYRIQSVPFAGGGEGDIYDIVGVSGYVAKVYKLDKRTTERECKLSVMVSNKPSVMEQYAWPLDVLYENGQFIGYVMPKINGKEKLRNIYVYDKRKGKPWSLFIAIAKNLSAAVHNVHEIHQVIGDLNPENILVDPYDGMVTLVDTDSYHISDSGRTYRCGVGMPEFVAPELQGIHFPSAPLPTFTPESDRFALAVLIFALLMNGAHPFSCKVISGSSSKFQPIDNMQNGKCAFFPDSRSSNMDIPRYAPDMSSLPDNIQKLFRRAFIAGHRNPALRPSAEEWYNALEQLEANLKTCLKDSQHIYYYGAKECPWCKVNEKMRSISQSAFNISSQSGSNSGSRPVTAGGHAQQFTPSNYRYTPSSSSSGTQSSKKRYGGWIALGIAVLALVLIIKSCSSGNDSEFQSNTELDNPETQSNAAVASTVLLGDVDPLLYDEGDSFYTLDSVLDATGETWNNVVHPGSTGTTGGTGGMGAHKAKGFNRTYTNNMYSHFSGTIFLNREYVLYTDHILTLLFEVYGDNSLLYRAPYLETGIEQCAFSFDIDIHKYSKIRIHFEVINDSGMFSWEDCIFGISNATFSLKPISELNVPFVEDKTEYITKPAELGLELKNATPLLSENGDSFYSEFSVTDCNGITYTDVVHPGSTGTTGSTRGMGAHEAKGFNRTYLNENYSTFSGTLFLSDAYAHYTNHTLTLLFEIYGDGGLIYSAPALTTGKVQSQVDVNIDISNYSKITIHFEAINDTNMFSWEDCVFGISNACFK